MNRNSILTFAAMLIVSGCVACFGDDHQPPKAGDGCPEVDFRIDASKVVTENFLGFGTQYNNNLFTSLTAVSDGVTESNLPDLEKKVLALNSQYVRIFFDSKCWPDNDKYDPEYMPSFVRTVELAQRTGSLVNITYWHSSKEADMPAFADVIYDLLVKRSLTCVRQVTIQNEVNDTKITQADYLAIYTAFDTRLRELGIRNRIEIVGGDLTLTNQASWFAFMAGNMSHLLDGYSSHIYWDHWDLAKPNDRLNGIAGELAKMSGDGVKPCYVTEYGIRGEKISGDVYANPGYLRGSKTPIGWTNVNAFKHALFHIDALNAGMAGLVKWDCYKAKYDNGNQYFSVIGPGKDGYPLYPSYWMTWLFTHTCATGWKVIAAMPTVATLTPKALAAMTDGGDNFTLYALGTSSARINFRVDGLPAGRVFRVFAWNDDLTGVVSELDSVTSDDSGILSFDVKSGTFVAVTTLDVKLPENPN